MRRDLKHHEAGSLARLVSFAAAALALVATSACATLGRHELLEARVKKLEEDRQKIRASIEADVERLEDIRVKLKQAEDTLRKSGATLVIRVESLEADLPKVRGELEAVLFNLKRANEEIARLRQALAQEAGVLSVLLPHDLPKDADGMWKAAKARHKQGDALVARAIYQTFEASYPKDKRAAQAVMEIAGLLIKDGDVKAAMAQYANIEARYPASPLVPKAVLKIAELFVKDGHCKKAKATYEYLARTYKSASEAATAAARARDLPKTCKER